MSMSMTASTHDAALLHSGWDASASVALGSIASHLFAPTGPTTPAEEIASGQFEAAQLHLALQAAGMHGDQRHDHGHGLDHDHDASAAAMVDFDALASHYAATTAAVLGDHSVAASPAPGSTVGSIVSSPVAGTLESFVAANSSGLPAPPSPPSTSWYPPPGSSIDLAGITTDHSLPVVVSQPSTIMPDLNAVVPIHDYASSSALPYIPEFAQPHHHQFPAYHFPHLAYPPSPESPLPPLLFGASAAAAESHDTSMLDAFVATASSMPQSAPAILEGPIQSYFPSILADTAPLAVSPSVIMHRRSHSLSCLTSASEAAAAATAAALHHELASTSPTVFGFSAPNSPVVLSQPDLDASLADALQPPRKRPRSKSESVALASGTGSGHLGHLQHLFHHPHAHSLQHMYSQPPLESPVPVGLSASSRSNLRPLLPAPTATASSASDAPATTSAAPASTSTPAGASVDQITPAASPAITKVANLLKRKRSVSFVDQHPDTSALSIPVSTAGSMQQQQRPTIPIPPPARPVVTTAAISQTSSTLPSLPPPTTTTSSYTTMAVARTRRSMRSTHLLLLLLVAAVLCVRTTHAIEIGGSITTANTESVAAANDAGADDDDDFLPPVEELIDHVEDNIAFKPLFIDPLEDRVILWTRVTPATPRPVPVTVTYEVATDAHFRRIVRRGAVLTSPDVDYTVKVDVKQLSPLTTYYYRFKVPAAGTTSPVGRTKTLPRPGAKVDALKIAVVTCINAPHGFFHALGHIAGRNDIDLVYGAGDSIYEYSLEAYPSPIKAMPASRNPQPAKIIATLSDYRIRHAQYKADANMKKFLASVPYVVTLDDHELADNAWAGGSQDHRDSVNGPWSARKLAGLRAFHEFMPIRPAKAEGELLRVYRKFQYGSLVDMVILDTRSDGRDQQAKGNRDTRRLIGKAQEKWLYDSLGSSRATWRLIGNQVLFAPVPQKILKWEIEVTSDTWSGYPAARSGLLNFLRDHKINDTACITGDLHASYASNLFIDGKYDKSSGAGSLMTEFVAPSVTSATPVNDNWFLAKLAGPVLGWFNKGAKYIDLKRHGYITIDLTKQRLRTEYWFTDNVKEADGDHHYLGAAFEQRAGSNRITWMREY
uniref:Alkaline phosphatase D n=1 Tax=Blastocladiella emersonii TaxID=4808 RepID=A0A238HJB7_BLAEM|nr:Alkaline phosphatase D [Blastocladiella emersonii]